jgi:hypothetical protein
VKSKGTICVAGALAQNPGNGGLTWCHLQFLLGFQRLGWEVLFLDRLSPEMCVDDGARPTSFEESANLRYFRHVMSGFGLTDASSLTCGGRTAGVPREEVLRRVAASALLFNVMGYIEDEAILAKAQRRVFVDIDPGFPQMWRELGLYDAFAGHDAFVTLGRNIGKPGCAIPTCGLKWISIAQPVVLEQWPAQPAAKADAPFTSIGAWRGLNAPVEYKGRTYGLRVHEFRKFAELPLRCPGVRFEMALDIHPADAKDLGLLRENGWSVVEPKSVAGGPSEYRAYLADSRAEFMVPKQMYVQTNSGLLSDRSAYYLASGRPVLARDTGLAELYPVGEGLITFTTIDEAVAGVEAINRDYSRHSRAARTIAEEHFDSDRVLTGLLANLDIS